MRNRKVGFVAASISVASLSVLGCKLEVKQDTPQATVATFIKMYEKKSFDHLDEIVDGLGERVDARQEACSAETLRFVRCTDELVRCFSGGAYKYGCTTSPECKDFKLSNCTCNGKGKQAAEHASAYTSTRAHDVFTNVGFSANSCKITSSDAVARKDLGEWGYDESLRCTDVADADELASVGVKCDTQVFQFLLRKRAGKWFWVAPDQKTRIGLAFSTSPTEAQKNKQRQDDLNKDLK
jgi:hypothetical protein